MNIHSPDFDPAFLDIVERNGTHVLYSHDQPLLTEGGHLWSHESERLMKSVLTEFLLADHLSMERVTLGSVLEYLTDSVIHATGDPFKDQFVQLLANDPIIQIKRGVAQPKGGQVTSLDDGITPMLNFHFWSSSSLIRALNRFAEEQIHRVEDREELHYPVESLIEDIYGQATPEMKACVRVLSDKHHAWLVLPMLLVYRRITPGEYAKALVSFGTRQADANITMSRYPQFAQDAYVVCDFLDTVATEGDAELSLASCLATGEGDFVEYKSTLRWDIRAGKTSQAVERACLKTIAAFLNTSGGVLLIGIRDDGSVEGVETDRFPNEDKFLLHLWTLIRTCLGRDVSPYILTRLEKRDEKTICVVRCTRSSRPVFLRQPGFNEEFYIRVGPGSAAMDISEALRYIADHFPG